MKLIISILCAVLLCVNSSPILHKSNIDETTFFMNHVELRDSQQYNLYWNFTETDITFKAVVKTNGWLGFGLSPNGGMYSSDVMLAWFSPDGTENLVDAHVSSSGLHRPIVDKYQNWQKLFMKQENGFLTVVFTRKLVICGQADSGEVNLDVTQTQPIIFAFGDSFDDEVRTFPKYHGASNRGSKVLPILGSLNEQVVLDMDKLEYQDFLVDTDLPEGIVTEYYCQLFKIPESWTQKKRHVVRYDTITTPENLKYVHHWLMYECDATVEQYIAQNGKPKPGTCLDYNNNWGPIQGHCKRISLAWATGGDLEVVLPKEYGYPIGGSDKEFKYFFIQMHYENPGLDKNIHDNSGFRLYVTEEFRPIEFGILTIGSESGPSALIIPPNVNSLRVDNICKNDFINPMINEADVDKLTIFAQLPHTHLAGTQMFSKVLKNNKEVEHISNNQYYDSNFQYVNFMAKPVILQPNDEIISSCVYNTQGRDKYTLGGLGTYDEMCLNFIWYYPRSPKFAQCLVENDINEAVKFFSKLDQQGDFEWVVNNDYTFFPDTIASLEASQKLRDNPEYTEKLFQDFYDYSDKTLNAYGDFGRISGKYAHVDIERLVEDKENC